MTLMWCSFDQRPMILRVYGAAAQIHPRDAAWDELASLFPVTSGARQFLDVSVAVSKLPGGLEIGNIQGT